MNARRWRWAIVSVPVGTTRDDLIDTASHGPIPGPPSGSLATLSPSASAWTEMDFSPGT